MRILWMITGEPRFWTKGWPTQQPLIQCAQARGHHVAVVAQAWSQVTDRYLDTVTEVDPLQLETQLGQQGFTAIAVEPAPRMKLRQNALGLWPVLRHQHWACLRAWQQRPPGSWDVVIRSRWDLRVFTDATVFCSELERWPRHDRALLISDLDLDTAPFWGDWMYAMTGDLAEQTWCESNWQRAQQFSRDHPQMMTAQNVGFWILHMTTGQRLSCEPTTVFSHCHRQVQIIRSFHTDRDLSTAAIMGAKSQNNPMYS